jgi:hypothetical protein
MRILAIMNKLLSVILGIALICGSSTAFAQGNSNTRVSNQELTAFAKAYAEVQQIRSQYEPSLQKTKDARESERLQREANAKLKKTLDKQGLSIDRYNKIYAAVNANEALRRKALKMVEQERKQS